MKLIKHLLTLLLLLIILVASYLAYAYLAYNRIPDQQELKVVNNSTVVLEAGKDFSVLTYNIGYASYPPDYTFFMDCGTEVLARNPASVRELLNGSIRTIENYRPDIVLLQEVDIKGRRSHNIDQTAIISQALPSYGSSVSINYDSPFLFYPITQPFGSNLSSIVTLSKFKIQQLTRRSLPVATDFNKFFDLDRCYSVAELPVSNGKSLFVYNLHLTAFGGNPAIRDAQVKMLAGDIAAKLQNGHYVICGGDFNHDILQNSVQYFNGPQANFEWAQPFPQTLLPNKMRLANNYPDAKLIPTARNLDKPYVRGQSTVMIIDGFFISDNIELVQVENIDNDFKYSDHNPVLLKIKLK